MPIPVAITKSYDGQRSHNGESPLLKPTGIQFATKYMLATKWEHRKLTGVKTMSLFGYEVQFVLFGELPVFQNLNYKLQRKLSNVLPNQQSHQVLYSNALASTVVPYQMFTTASCSYRAGVLERRCGEAFWIRPSSPLDSQTVGLRVQ